MLQDKHIVITGGAGFIGTRLAKILAEHNQITLVDILRRDAFTGTPLGSHPNVRLVKADVRDGTAVREALRGATHVIHLASIAGVDTVMKNPVLTMEVSLKGTFNVLEAARDESRLERFVDFSTSEVFGRYAYRVAEGDVTSLGAVGEARWTYAVSKLATEHLCHVMHLQHGLPAVCIRPFNIYGPGQVGEGAIHHFVVRAVRGETLTVHNEGDQIRAWCYIDDLIDGLMMTLEKKEAVGKTFNIGNPRSAITVYQLACLVARLAGSKSEVRCVPWPYPDVELRVPDISSARTQLGFAPKVELEEGLERTIAWYRAELDAGAIAAK